MNKLTKTQAEIEVLAKRVPQLTKEQTDWARHNIEYFVQVRHGVDMARCPDCQHHFFIKDAQRIGKAKWCKSDDLVICPHCGAHIQLRTIPDSLARENTPREVINRKQEEFFQVMNVVGGWQVTRLIYMRRYCYVRKENTPWEFYEVCQAWNHPEQARTHFRALEKACCMNHPFNPYSLFDYVAERNEDGTYKRDERGNILLDAIPRALKPRKAGSNNYFETTAVVPDAQILPFYKKRGLTKDVIVGQRVHGNVMTLIEELIGKGNPMLETLIKAKEYALVNHIIGTGFFQANEYFSAWKITQRNGYKFKNKQEWIDLVRMLLNEHMDYRSPHYVCPADLHAMHQQILGIIERRRQKAQQERELRELERAQQRDAKYQKRIAKFLDMDIHNDYLTIVVLPNVKAFKEEGDHLHHCVYRCAYYDKPESLILSARDAKGKRWETIEVSLKDYTIRQCYGYGDKFTERHDEIKKLVQENMWQIRERNKVKRMRKAS